MNLPRTAVILVSLLLLGSLSQAEASPTFSYGPFPLTGPDTGSTSFAITIPQYDAATYGPLQNVRFAFTGEMLSPFQIAFENLASQAIRFNFAPYLAFDIQTTNFHSPAGQPFPPSPPFPPFPTPFYPLGAFKGVEDFMGSDSTTISVTGGSGSDTRTYSGFPGLSDFIGTGMVTLNLTGALLFHETSTLAGSVPAYKFLTPATFASNFTVTYNYTAVAEPSSLGLLGVAALVGLGRRVTVRRGTLSGSN